jgi:hypothetical protein
LTQSRRPANQQDWPAGRFFWQQWPEATSPESSRY